MRVLGIDPGTAACGYGVVEGSGNRIRALEFAWWKTSPRERPELRLRTIFEGVAELVERFSPDALAIEESFVGADPRTALSVGQARGAILVAAALADVECTEYAPSSVKQAVCGYGRAEKAQVQRMVASILGLRAPPTPSHAADALAVAICHALAPPLLRAAASGHVRPGA
jgi:crossover junction endodeoxyribonuclease RuvC